MLKVLFSQILQNYLLINLIWLLGLPITLVSQQRYLDEVFPEEKLKVIPGKVYVRYEKDNCFINLIKDADWYEQSQRNPAVRTMVTPLIEELIRRIDVKELEVNIFMPDESPPHPRPLIIFAHGGAFVYGDRYDNGIEALCKDFARRGYVTASIDYRKFRIDYPSLLKAAYVAIQDGKAAVRFFKAHAAEYQINSDYIFFGGVSAGAIMALHVGFLDPGEDIAGRNRKFDQILGCLDCAGNDHNHSARIKGVINIAGGILDLKYFGNNNTNLISFHSDDDKIVSIDHDLPLQPFMGKYNELVDRIIDIAGIPRPNRYELAKMEKMYGSRSIHSSIRSLNPRIQQKFKQFSGLGHSLLLADRNNVKMSSYDTIENMTAGFLFHAGLKPNRPTTIVGFRGSAQSGSTVVYSTTARARDYRWQVRGGNKQIMSGGRSIKVTWGEAGRGSVSLSVGNEFGLYSDPIRKSVQIEKATKGGPLFFFLFALLAIGAFLFFRSRM